MWEGRVYHERMNQRKNSLSEHLLAARALGCNFFLFFWKPRLRGVRHCFKLMQLVSAWAFLPYNAVTGLKRHGHHVCPVHRDCPVQGPLGRR